MGARVAFSTNAVSDLHAIVDCISIGNERRGQSFAQELSLRIVRKLSIFPESGATIGKHRYLVFGNHVAIYDYVADQNLVTIAMVTEGHGNWRKQFEEPT